jgi:hypothetical protein
MDTITVHYWHNGNLAYWTVNDGGCTWSTDTHTFCANTYATFRGDRIGEHQVYGPARSPLSVKRMHDWFRKEYRHWRGYPSKLSVRRVKDIGDLPCAD